MRAKLVAALVAVGVSGCGAPIGAPDASPTSTEPLATAAATATAEPTTLDPVAATLAECEDAPEPAGEPVNLRVTANSSGFDTDLLEGARHCEPFTITFDNNDTDPQFGLHNVTITLASSILSQVTHEEPFAGPGIRVYEIPALPAGEYTFICTRHIDFMKGTLVVSAS